MGPAELGGEASELVQIRDQYYILANSAFADDRTRVLKDGETFGVFDRRGDIHPIGHGHQGLYHDSTRFLSRLELRIADLQPLLLNSTVAEDNRRLAVDLTNPPLPVGDGRFLLQDSIHLFRTAVVWGGACFQRLRVRSFALEPARFDLTVRFAADFADIFEIRGVERPRAGQALKPRVEGDTVALEYRGLDRRLRRIRLCFEPSPLELKSGEARFDVTLLPKGETTLFLRAICECDDEVAAPMSYADASAAATRALRDRGGPCRIETANERFNDWINRSSADLSMMLTQTPHGAYPYAGVPWFNAPFGRDAIVTALEMLAPDPSIAATVLRFLAETQATQEDSKSDAEPGKILHEARDGEMCALGEVPFGKYYGTVDATPLFVMLAHAYYERTADRQLLQELWPAVLRALEWIETYGDPDGDGFLEYQRKTPAGLTNQGWKDSHDSVFHQDGTLATGPIALCEVQAYVYGALRGAADLADVLSDSDRAETLRQKARALKEAFAEHFWVDDLQTFALALDGEKRPCRVRSSNAGQCLWTGLASPDHAEAVVRGLMMDDAFTGWGIRTLSAAERRYNPMAYHNGSVWPHDNALIAAGMARYGLREPVQKLLAGMFDATLFTDLNRLPELFCGFPRRSGEGPTPYPVACAPQAWASGAVFLMLQSLLGLSISAVDQTVLFSNPILPPFLEAVRIRDLQVADSSFDIDLVRHPEDVGIHVLRRTGDVKVLAVK